MSPAPVHQLRSVEPAKGRSKLQAVAKCGDTSEYAPAAGLPTSFSAWASLVTCTSCLGAAAPAPAGS